MSPDDPAYSLYRSLCAERLLPVPAPLPPFDTALQRLIGALAGLDWNGDEQ